MAMKVVQHRIKKFLYGILLTGFTTIGVQAQKVNPLIPDYASKMETVKLWVFHGSDDRTVLAKHSRDMVEAVQAVGGNVKYTEYSGVDRDAWGWTYSSPEVWDRLFSQSRK
jgi:predicted peptidase